MMRAGRWGSIPPITTVMSAGNEGRLNSKRPINSWNNHHGGASPALRNWAPDNAPDYDIRGQAFWGLRFTPGNLIWRIRHYI